MLIWEVQVFGFHLASLEVRQHSQVHREALEDIRKNGINSETLQPRTVEVLDTLRTIASIQQRYGVDACRRYIISFTQEVEHIEDVFELLNLAIPEPDNRPVIDVVPLFETMEDLNNAVAVLDKMIHVQPVVQRYQVNGYCQEVMLGYSDSSKDVGPVAATFALHTAQEQIATWAKANNIQLTLFHGRGGALGRGGGPAHRAVLAQPPGSVESVFKLTEQGETIMARYGNTELGIRHIETVAAATLLNSTPSVEVKNQEMDSKYSDLAQQLTDFSRQKFHKLVQSDDFASWFAIVTPLEELGMMPIGSRPAKRGLSTRSLEDLRAIPWVFAWSQARINLAAWYGFGGACQEFINSFEDAEDGLCILQQAYKEWDLFTTLVDNIEMSIAKTDERIADLYLSLSDRDDLKAQVLDELSLTAKWVTQINCSSYPLARKKVLGQAIQIRGPYIDALSMLQFATLRSLRHRQDSFTPDEIEELKYLLLCTVSGISAGLQNTG
jgi:phosphoenolpyruvate carboxylase